MVDVVVSPHVPVVAAVAGLGPSSTAEWLGSSSAANASIDAYLAAGDRMAMIMGLTSKVLLVLLVLIAVGWVLGVLPGAVRLI